MQPRVTAVLIARNGAQYLPKTLAALAAQTRRPDRVIPVDVSSTDLSPELMLKAYPGELVRTPGRRTFGGALSHALASVPSTGDDEWLWLLGHDNAPTPGALSALLGAVEVAPSVAVAGPKLMSLYSPDLIVGFGETMTRLGRSLPVVANELDFTRAWILSHQVARLSAPNVLVVNHAKAFDKSIGVSGLVITKLDGTAKGGVLAAIARQCPKPVRFIGVGEGIDDLQAFRAGEFVEALLGS